MSHVPQELGGLAALGATGSMAMSRRDFFRYSVGGLTILCLLPSSCRDDEPGAEDERLPLLWVETGVCTGCMCSVLDSFAPAAESLVPALPFAFQETLMESFGARAIDELLAIAQSRAGAFMLVVDGAIPRGEASRMTMLGTSGDGDDYTAEELVAKLAAQAARVVALGTCASFGGIPGSAPATGVYVSVAEVIGATPIRIPGCPPNTSWIVSALMALVRGDSLELDSLGRPTSIFGKTVHDGCPRRESFAANDFAAEPGDQARCLLKVGCKGMMAHGDCPSRLWLGRSYCIKANQPCIGCTAPGFLDARTTVDGKDVGLEGKPAAPFYQALEASP